MAYEVKGYCITCGRCSGICPSGALHYDGVGMAIDPELCVDCGACAEACRMRIIKPVGYVAPAPELHNSPKVYDCDLVIIGGGSSGVIAAAKVAETGKKVVILEKLETLGGGGQYAQGIRMFGTKWELEAGAKDQTDDYVRSAMATVRWELNPQLVYNTFKALPGMFDWMCTWANMEENFAYGEGPFGKGITSIRGGKPAGQFIVEKCEEHLTKLGVTVLYQTAAKQLILRDGKVTGVVAEDPGGTTIVSCKACLLATGNVSFGEVLKETVPEYFYATTRPSAHRLPTNTGDHVTLCRDAGIQVDLGSVAAAYLGGRGVPFIGVIGNHVSRGEALKVNKEGKRWINETWSDGEGPIWAQLKQPEALSYTILDADLYNMEPLPGYVQHYDRAGRNVGQGVPDENGNFRPGGSVSGGGGPGGPPIAGMNMQKPTPEEVAAAADKLQGGHYYAANTLEELADKIGCDRETFLATVERYNELCAEGRDADYFKPAQYMIPIKTAPFFAVQTHIASDGVFGGIDIDENTHVLSGDAVVPGLYCIGDAVGNRYICPGGEKLEIINDFAYACASAYQAAVQIEQDLA